MSSQHNDKTGTLKNDQPNPSSPGDREPIVNTEEQNKPINPGDRDYKEASNSAEPLINAGDNSKESKPDGGAEVETPGRIEGEDAEGTERKIPSL